MPTPKVEITYALPPDGRLFLPTNDAARALGVTRNHFYALLRVRHDAATIRLLRGRSRRGSRCTKWHYRAVLDASESLAGRDWPATRSRAGTAGPTL